MNVTELISEAECRHACGMHAEAFQFASTARTGLVSNGPEELRAQAVGVLIRVHTAREEFGDALLLADQEADLLRAQHLCNEEAIVLLARADALRAMGRQKAALRVAQSALEVFRRWQNETWVASALKAVVAINLDLGSQASVQEALLAGMEALEIFERAGDFKGQATALVLMAKAYLLQRDYDEAYQRVLTSVELSQELSWDVGHAAALRSMSLILVEWRGRPGCPFQGLDVALEKSKLAVALSKKMRDIAGEVDGRRIVAQIYLINQRPKDALYMWQAVLSLGRSLDDMPVIAEALDKILQIHVQEGHAELAVDAMQEEAKLAVEAKSNVRRILFAFRKVTALQLQVKGVDDALSTAQAAQELLEHCGEAPVAAGALKLVAEIMIERKSHGEAFEIAAKAQSLLREARDLRTLADLLQWLFRMHTEMGNTAEAFQTLTEKHSVYREAGWRHEEAAELLVLSELLFSSEGPKPAMQKAKEAANIYRHLQDEEGEARALLAMAQFQAQDGRATEALTTSRSAQHLFQSLGDSRGEAASLMCAAGVYLAEGISEEAVALIAQVRQLYQQLGENSLEEGALQDIVALLVGLVQRDCISGRAPAPRLLQDAIESTITLLDRLRMTGDVAGQIATWTQLSQLYLANEEGDAALKAATECYLLAAELDDAEELAYALLLLAQGYRSIGDVAAARTVAHDALALFGELGDDGGMEMAGYARDAAEEPMQRLEAFPLLPGADAETVGTPGMTDALPSVPRGSLLPTPPREASGYRARWKAMLGSRTVDHGVVTYKGQRDLAPPQRYSIIGTWDDWTIHKMHWDAVLSCFEFVVALGSEGQVSFTILKDDDWDNAVCPSVPDANPREDYKLLGPDWGEHCGMWTIYKPDGCHERTHYKIRFFVSEDGSPLNIKWNLLHSQEQTD